MAIRRKPAAKKAVKRGSKPQAAKKAAPKRIARKKVAGNATRKVARKPALPKPAARKPAVRKVKPTPRRASPRPAAAVVAAHPLGLRELHVSFNTRRSVELTTFYRDALELPAQAMTEMGYLNVDICHGGSLGFMDWSPSTMTGEEAAPFGAAEAGLYVLCADVDFVYGKLTERGIAFEGPPADQPWGHRTVRTHDPEGRAVVFAQAMKG